MVAGKIAINIPICNFVRNSKNFPIFQPKSLWFDVKTIISLESDIYAGNDPLSLVSARRLSLVKPCR
jgi:hypothetical protein